MSPLVVSEILKLFVNIWTPDDKYPLSVKASILCNHFKCDYPKSKSIFRIFSAYPESI